MHGTLLVIERLGTCCVSDWDGRSPGLGACGFLGLAQPKIWNVGGGTGQMVISVPSRVLTELPCSDFLVANKVEKGNGHHRLGEEMAFL